MTVHNMCVGRLCVHVLYIFGGIYIMCVCVCVCVCTHRVGALQCGVVWHPLIILGILRIDLYPSYTNNMCVYTQ